MLTLTFNDTTVPRPATQETNAAAVVPPVATAPRTRAKRRLAPRTHTLPLAVRTLAHRWARAPRPADAAPIRVRECACDDFAFLDITVGEGGVDEAPGFHVFQPTPGQWIVTAVPGFWPDHPRPADTSHGSLREALASIVPGAPSDGGALGCLPAE